MSAVHLPSSVRHFLADLEPLTLATTGQRIKKLSKEEKKQLEMTLDLFLKGTLTKGEVKNWEEKVGNAGLKLLSQHLIQGKVERSDQLEVARIINKLGTAKVINKDPKKFNKINANQADVLLKDLSDRLNSGTTEDKIYIYTFLSDKKINQLVHQLADAKNKHTSKNVDPALLAGLYEQLSTLKSASSSRKAGIIKKLWLASLEAKNYLLVRFIHRSAISSAAYQFPSLEIWEKRLEEIHLEQVHKESKFLSTHGNALATVYNALKELDLEISSYQKILQYGIDTPEGRRGIEASHAMERRHLDELLEKPTRDLSSLLSHLDERVVDGLKTTEQGIQRVIDQKNEIRKELLVSGEKAWKECQKEMKAERRR